MRYLEFYLLIWVHKIYFPEIKFHCIKKRVRYSCKMLEKLSCCYAWINESSASIFVADKFCVLSCWFKPNVGPSLLVTFNVIYVYGFSIDPLVIV